jgi:hypothetical protein
MGPTLRTLVATTGVLNLLAALNAFEAARGRKAWAARL